jgi:hypothetical protein
MNVQLERLSDGRVEWLERMDLDRDSLLAVRAGGPRGDPARRRHARLHPLVVQSGPYLIGGYLHARAGVGPVDDREPAADGSLVHGLARDWVAGRRHRQWAGTIIFNRRLVEALELVGEADLEFGMTTYPIVAAPPLSSRRRG